MPKQQQLPRFQRHVKGKELKIERTLSDIEKRGVAGALDICRVLADEINRELHTTKVRQLVDNPSLLAEFQVAIERADSVLGPNRLRRRRTGRQKQLSNTRRGVARRFFTGCVRRPGQRGARMRRREFITLARQPLPWRSSQIPPIFSNGCSRGI
jgi:hypothetical protein